jgi:Flp pilus assembly protein TadD
VTLAPESARALQALMAVQTVSGDTVEALRTGFEAVRRNPFDTDILADLGARLTRAGRPREGWPLLLRAAEVNRVWPVWHEFYLFL